MTLRTARKLLNMTRQLEEKVFHANVHVRVSAVEVETRVNFKLQATSFQGWKPTETAPEATSPHSAVDSGSSSDSSCDSMLDVKDNYASHSTDDLMAVVKDRLLQLEVNIERRYFMPAFNR